MRVVIVNLSRQAFIKTRDRSPQAAVFKVGYYKIHPEIPEELSERAHNFILRCFEPDPNVRATAAELLEDIFLTEYGIIRLFFHQLF